MTIFENFNSFYEANIWFLFINFYSIVIPNK